MLNKKLSLFSGSPQLLHGGDYNPDQWLDRPDIIAEDFRLMKLAGCNTFSIGIFSWTRCESADGIYHFDWLDDIMERMAENGHHVLLATPSGAKPAWLAKAYPEICRVGKTGLREPYTKRHNHCWSSPVYRKKVCEINNKLAERYSHHPALAGWHISNEYNGACYCGLCQEKFRDFLKEKYKTLDALNKAWSNSFWNHLITDWQEITSEGGSEGNTMDWLRFNTEQCREFMKMEIDTVKSWNPEIPAATNFMGPWFFTDLNYWHLADICDYICDDVYPDWDTEPDRKKICSALSMRHDMLRSMAASANKPFFIMESSPSATNWQDVHRLKRPGQHRWQELTAVGHGAEGTLYFQWRKSQGNVEKFHGAVVDHVGHEHTRVFNDVASLGKLYKNFQDIPGSEYPVKAALIYDVESLWAFELSSGPGRVNKRFPETVQAHYNALWNNHIQLDVIESKCDFSKYKLLAVPMLFVLQPGVAERLKEFVRNGGTLVMSYLSGYLNHNLHCLPGGWPGEGLMELFGIWNEEINGLASFDSQSFDYNGITFPVIDYHERIHLKTAAAAAVFNEDFNAGEPAVTCNHSGKGTAWYIAAGTDIEFLEKFYSERITECDIKTILPVKNHDIHVTMRQSGNEKFIFLFNTSEKPVQINLPECKYFDRENKEEITGSITLPVWGAKILTCSDLSAQHKKREN